MKNPERYRHLRVDWVGQSSTQSITLCGVEGKDIGPRQTLCPDCAQVGEALNVCGHASPPIAAGTIDRFPPPDHRGNMWRHE